MIAKFFERREFRIALVAITAILLVSAYSWLTKEEEEFPRIEPGAYLGEIFGIPLEPGNDGQKFYLESGSPTEDLFVVVLGEGWIPQGVETVPKGNDDQGGLYPITVEGPDHRLKFKGKNVVPGRYEGVVTDIGRGSQGSWYLRVLPAEEAATKSFTDEVKLWLSNRAELDHLESRISNAEASVAQQKDEIDKLSRFVTERDELRTRSDEKFNQAREELKTIREQFAAKQKEAADLEAKITLAQRVTSMGKLVSLARESLEREARWVSSMLETSGAAGDPEFEAAYERALKVDQIKRTIALEKQQIGEMSGELPEAELSNSDQANL